MDIAMVSRGRAGRLAVLTTCGAVAVATAASDPPGGSAARARDSMASAPLAWSATDLGTLGGDYSQASALNERGQIIGDSETVRGEDHAFLWENGRMRGPRNARGKFHECGRHQRARADRRFERDASGHVARRPLGEGSLARSRNARRASEPRFCNQRSRADHRREPYEHREVACIPLAGRQDDRAADHRRSVERRRRDQRTGESRRLEHGAAPRRKRGPARCLETGTDQSAPTRQVCDPQGNQRTRRDRGRRLCLAGTPSTRFPLWVGSIPQRWRSTMRGP